MEIARGDRCPAQKPQCPRDVEHIFAVCDCVPLNTLAEAQEMFLALSRSKIESRLYFAGVVRPVQQGLALPPSTRQIAARAVLL
jgi:hypothetical protein